MSFDITNTKDRNLFAKVLDERINLIFVLLHITDSLLKNWSRKNLVGTGIFTTLTTSMSRASGPMLFPRSRHPAYPIHEPPE